MTFGPAKFQVDVREWGGRVGPKRYSVDVKRGEK